jgi:hypothetical protein
MTMRMMMDQPRFALAAAVALGANGPAAGCFAKHDTNPRLGSMAMIDDGGHAPAATVTATTFKKIGGDGDIGNAIGHINRQRLAHSSA